MERNGPSSFQLARSTVLRHLFTAYFLNKNVIAQSIFLGKFDNSWQILPFGNQKWEMCDTILSRIKFGLSTIESPKLNGI